MSKTSKTVCPIYTDDDISVEYDPKKGAVNILFNTDAWGTIPNINVMRTGKHKNKKIMAYKTEK